MSRRTSLTRLAVAGLVLVGIAHNFAFAAGEKRPFWLQPFLLQNEPETPGQVVSPQQKTKSRPTTKPSSSPPVPNPPVTSARTKQRQGFNPFAWTNSGSNKTIQHIVPQTPPAANTAEQRLPEVIRKSKVAQPLYWSNVPNNKPQAFEPPALPPVGKALSSLFTYQEARDELVDGPEVSSGPPEDATDEELIAWEREKFPWLHPFYMAENDANELPVELDAAAGNLNESVRSSVLARPFLWSNEHPAEIARRPATGSRPVAYFQNGEEIPPPGQQGESIAPGEISGSGPNLGGEPEQGVLAEAETLGREPEDNSLQFLRADTVLLKPGQFQFDYGLTYTLFDQTIPLLSNPTPTTVAVEHARFRQREMLVPLEIRMGFLRRLQLFLNVPFGWANTEFTATGFEETANDGGIGDISFGGTFLLRQGNHEQSDAIVSFAASAPTGEVPFFPLGISPSDAALGSGTWSLASNLLFIRNYDPVVFFYGVGTRQSFQTDINGVEFRPGAEYNYRMGVGFGVNESITFSTRFQGAYVTEAQVAGLNVLGSIQEPMTLEFAMTVSRCKRLIEPFVNFGLTDDAQAARIGITWTR